MVVFDPQPSLSLATAAVFSTWDQHSEGIMAVRTRSHNSQCDCTLAQDVDYSGSDLYWLTNVTSVAVGARVAMLLSYDLRFALV